MVTVRIVAGREGAEQVDREGVHDLRVDWLSQHSPEPNAFLNGHHQGCGSGSGSVIICTDPDPDLDSSIIKQKK